MTVLWNVRPRLKHQTLDDGRERWLLFCNATLDPDVPPQGYYVQMPDDKPETIDKSFAMLAEASGIDEATLRECYIGDPSKPKDGSRERKP